MVGECPANSLRRSGEVTPRAADAVQPPGVRERAGMTARSRSGARAQSRVTRRSCTTAYVLRSASIDSS